MWIDENESRKFWLSVLNDFRNRGGQDILIICVDNLLPAIQRPKFYSLCVLQGSQESYAVLKLIYKAATAEGALLEPDRFEEVWGVKYSLIVRFWRNNGEELSTFFK
ncbi:transposase [Paenibacillus lautus]